MTDVVKELSAMKKIAHQLDNLDKGGLEWLIRHCTIRLENLPSHEPKP